MEPNGTTQRDLGALGAALDGLKAEIDTRFDAVADQLRAIRSEQRSAQERESRSPDRALSVLALIASLLVPSLGALVAFIIVSGQPAATDREWLEKTLDLHAKWIGDSYRELGDAAARVKGLEEFRAQQERRNDRVDRRADTEAYASRQDKDALELQALEELMRRLSRIEEAFQRRAFLKPPPGSSDG